MKDYRILFDTSKGMRPSIRKKTLEELLLKTAKQIWKKTKEKVSIPPSSL